MRIKCARCGATKDQVNLWSRLARSIDIAVVCCKIGDTLEEPSYSPSVALFQTVTEAKRGFDQIDSLTYALKSWSDARRR